MFVEFSGTASVWVGGERGAGWCADPWGRGQVEEHEVCGGGRDVECLLGERLGVEFLVSGDEWAGSRGGVGGDRGCKRRQECESK